MPPEGTNIGHPVRATGANKDNLTLSFGGTDAASFSIESGTGQLKTKAKLEFEIKNTYSVTVSVSDGEGGADSIAVTIRVTDVVEVAVTDEDNQVVVLVDPTTKRKSLQSERKVQSRSRRTPAMSSSLPGLIPALTNATGTPRTTRQRSVGQLPRPTASAPTGASTASIS